MTIRVLRSSVLAGQIMELSDVIADGKKAAIFLKSGLDKIYNKNDWEIKVEVKTRINDALMITFSEAEFKNDDIRNALSRISLGMSLDESTSKFNMSELIVSYQLKEVGIVFSDITGNSPMNVAKKTLAWFKKNEKKFKSM